MINTTKAQEKVDTLRALSKLSKDDPTWERQALESDLKEAERDLAIVTCLALSPVRI